ncbi:hypothetical protein COCHEDRAFT_1023889 [Bipolaris maydis C5]|uniref:Adenylate kinase active site lid domain-containing protein n=1 Tax=Cochliobolus heterostrophus (strain C5 / ATCC 48332 / race O) TaxID=701091 RepID=M2SMV8_COCH5|nr:hypothetical protein COCHEDRAFT_1023889 [Bipolaris maydis C5]KAJ5042663.1 adenylate kinase-domain-containing protein [Bipolaris maydis]KAJ5052584.1 adenylate kinase-domain-containing protein [Bipolaris maydis]KAJ6192257.1 adenylate kinase-domain-containing protein [Bipolaris maydis]KAJ6203732.1 adenylate kinase-domain-containing protein [Bipolaris maydis]
MEATATTVVFVIGAPGSGKGTLCRRLSDEHGFCHLSIGDTLRRLVSNSMTDLVTASQVQRGELVSTEVLVSILQDSVKDSVYSDRRVILVDGLPRQLDQAMPVEEKIGSPALVLFFNCREEVAKNRFLTRKLLGREADNAVVFQKRYDEFTAENSKVIKMYQERNLLIEIDTNGETDFSYTTLSNRLHDTDLAQFLRKTTVGVYQIDTGKIQCME